MRIAHLTDLHYSKDKSTYDFETLFEALLDSLKHEHQEKKVDLVFITGDLVDKGGKSFGKDGYKKVEEKIFKSIASALQLENDKIVIIPGNHDVQEGDGDSLLILKGIRSEKVAGINEFVKNNTLVLKRSETGEEANNTGEPESGETREISKCLLSLHEFKAFESEFYKNSKNVASTNFESYFIFSFGKAKVGVAAFNSAWSCHSQLDREPDKNAPDDERKNIAFGMMQIQRAAEYFKGKTDFNIGLIHHPLGFNFYSAAEEKEIKEELVQGNFNMLFCGHTHKAEDRFYKDPFSGYYLIVTKSTFNDRRIEIEKYKSGFSLIDITYSSESHVNVTRHYRKYFHSPRKFGFDVEEAYNGKSSIELKTDFVGKAFVEFLKQENPLYDPNRKVLFEKVNSATQEYLKSHYPAITDIALKKFIERFLPDTNQFQHIRNDLKLNIRIDFIDNDYFSINELQTFRIVSSGDEVAYHTYTYIDKLLDGHDKSKVEVKKLLIDQREFKDDYKVETEYLQPEANFAKIRETRRLSTVLKGKNSYSVERELESVNSLKLNKVWKIEIINIFNGYEISVENPDKRYRVELFNISNNTNFSNIGEDGTPSDRPVTIKEKEGILVPGDTFFIFINLL